MINTVKTLDYGKYKLEQIKLLNKCSSKWTTFNGITGRLYTSSNGNSIFLARCAPPISAKPSKNGVVRLHF